MLRVKKSILIHTKTNFKYELSQFRGDLHQFIALQCLDMYRNETLHKLILEKFDTKTSVHKLVETLALNYFQIKNYTSLSEKEQRIVLRDINLKYQLIIS